MAVAFDTDVGITNQNLSGGSLTFTNYMTLGGSASLLIIAVDILVNSPGTISATWNGVSMTALAAPLVVNNGTTNSNIRIFGLVSPATGAHNLVVSVSGGSTDNFYVSGISFTGTSTVSVAAATTAYTTATGTSTTMSVTSSAAIPSTGMAVGYGSDIGLGFSSGTAAFFTGGTQIGQNQSGVNNDNAAYATGTGSTMTASAGLAGSDAWGILVFGVVAPSGDTLNIAMQPMFI